MFLMKLLPQKDITSQLLSDIPSQLSDDDLEAVVGGLSNEELIRRQVRKISEMMVEKNSQNDE